MSSKNDVTRAANSLVYYFRILFKQSELNWNSDNESEIQQIIYDIFDGVNELIDDKINNHENSNYHAE